MLAQSTSASKLPTKKTALFGAFGGLFSKIVKKQSDQNPQVSEKEKVLNTSKSNSILRPKLKDHNPLEGSLVWIDNELARLADPPKQFVGKFTTESLMKKINANLMDNKAIEDMIAQKKLEAQPLAQQRNTAGKKRTNIVAERISDKTTDPNDSNPISYSKLQNWRGEQLHVAIGHREETWKVAEQK